MGKNWIACLISSLYSFLGGDQPDRIADRICTPNPERIGFSAAYLRVNRVTEKKLGFLWFVVSKFTLPYFMTYTL
jgi:hypothetical protein